MKKYNMFILSVLFLFAFGTIFSVKVSATTVVNTTSEDAFQNAAKKMFQQYDNEESAGISSVNDSDDEYELKRLIVQSENGGSINLENIDAVKAVKSEDGLYFIQFEDEEKASEAAEILASQSNVDYVQPDSIITIDDEVSSSSYKVSTSASSSSTYGIWSWGVDYMGIDSFAEQVKSCVGSNTIKIAVVDTGIYKHPKFSSHIISGINYIESESGTNDLNGHGTHVTGIIYDCLRGLNVKIMPVKILDQTGTGSVGEMGLGIRYAADKGCKVINLSVNIKGDDHDDYLHASVEYAVEKNCVVVNSSGNAGKTVKYGCPADVSDAIVVGAINNKGSLASFSNKGNTVDVVAPGVGIYSTYLQSGFTTLDGTSMAAPHITGLATLIRLAYPSYSAAKVESVIKGYAKDLGNSGFDTSYGYGMPYVGNVTLNPATSISLNKTSVSIATAETTSLTATVLPSNATRKTVTWSSSNTNVAAVTSGGKIVGIGAGTATITAKTLNGKTATCKVKVSAADTLPYTSFWLSSYNSSTKKAVMSTKTFGDCTGIQIQLMNGSKKTVATKTVTTGSTVTFTGLSNQRVYYYKARAYYDVDGYRAYGPWAAKARIFYTGTATTTKVSSRKYVKITMPSATAGISSFEVWVSATGKTDSYKKLRTLAPGKSFNLYTLYGKKLASYGSGHKFYVILKPVYSLTGLADKKYVRKSFTLK